MLSAWMQHCSMSCAVFLALALGGAGLARGAAIQVDDRRPLAGGGAGEGAKADSPSPVVVPFRDSGAIKVHTVGVPPAVAGADERVIYKNTLGTDAVRFGAGMMITDDISTTAPVGCKLTRFRFTVAGRVIPTDPGGPYTVRYALYNNCPQAVTSTERIHYTDEPLPNTGIKIRGTDREVTFADDAPRTIEHLIDVGSPVAIPTNLWLGISFDRSNCGVALGAPAEIGFSDDSLDFPGFPCNGNLGGFPEQPHASFNAELFGGAGCPETFLGYKAANAAGPKYNSGVNVPFYDDIKLIANNCLMTGYEVAVRGQGWYTFGLYRDCSEFPSSLIPGTQRTFNVGLSTRPQLQLARFSFDPPIQLTSDTLYLRVTVGNVSSGGVVVAGHPATIGSTNESYFTINQDDVCEPTLFADPTLYGAFHFSITCAGPAPLGACCDPYLKQCSDGPDAGKRCPCENVCQGGFNDGYCCKSSADCFPTGTECAPFCAAPGTCAAVCREVPQVNCPFPPRGQDLDPKWREGAACSPDPFGFTPCGVAVCCHRNNQLEEICDHMTEWGCMQAPPLDGPRLWRLGHYCDESCPLYACLESYGSCSVPHPTPGCDDPWCCTQVCTSYGPTGAYCCEVEWDSACVAFAQFLCDTPPSNDSCAPDAANRLDGALTIPVPGSGTADLWKATLDPADPGFCCHGGVSQCVGGTNAGNPCVVVADCPSGVCPGPLPTPGARGYGSVWFNFVQPQGFTSAQVHTCASSSPAKDSLLQVFKAQDHSSPERECASLAVIGCNDDAPGCSSGGRNSKLCVKNLVPGETYYIMVAAKTPQTLGEYRVTVSANCTSAAGAANDYCPNAATVTDGATPFYINVNACVGGTNPGRLCTSPADCPAGSCMISQHAASFDCPAELCVPDALNDLWYNYTATCTGEAKFETCGESSATSPNTNLVVYDDCSKCPPVAGQVLGCNDNAYGNCGLGSRVVAPVEQGRCYKVRLADEMGFPVAGALTISCHSLDCQPNGIVDWQDIADCPPNTPSCADCNFNGVPDECDIRDGVSQDENGDGVPDECQQFCHSGEVRFVDPPDGVVDARRPHAPNNPSAPLGIQTIRATGPTGAPPQCWSLCETITSLARNAIENVVESPPGTYTITLARPITPGAVTTLTYTDFAANATTARFIAHPGNVNGDTAAGPADILDLIDALNGVAALPWGNYSGDLDHSGLIAPADVLEEIDLLNGANGNEIWNGTPRPQAAGVCP